jgi:hypothetical protein
VTRQSGKRVSMLSCGVAAASDSAMLCITGRDAAFNMILSAGSTMLVSARPGTNMDERFAALPTVC